MRRQEWIAAAAAGLLGLILWKRRRRTETPEESIPALAPVSPPSPAALPSPLSARDEAVGQGQALVVVALAGGAAMLGLWALAFILPPAFVAAGAAFGPLLLGAFTVGVLHVRAKGLMAGDAPLEQGPKR